jgi:hypothetical protein
MCGFTKQIDLKSITPSSRARTKEVEELLRDNCDVIHLRIHPSMVPFLTPMKQNGSNLGAYIAPVNHNKINTGISVNITSTMMGRFAQDDEKDSSQLQEMGSDAGVVFGYSEKHVRT